MRSAGHEHLYERIAPQSGVHHFVSGGGGRRLYSTRHAEFDEYPESTLHFMVLAIADDRLFFEAIAPYDRLIDYGVPVADAGSGSPWPRRRHACMAPSLQGGTSSAHGSSGSR